MNDGWSMINLGDLAKPATVLIERVSDLFEGCFKPFQIKRVAKAEAEREVIKASAQIKVDELQRRAIGRFIAEETRKQDNIEKIAGKAVHDIKDSAEPEKIESDWLTDFFDKCKTISDDEMQSLWAKVLAGEANNPGSFSKRAVNLLATIEKYEAQLFTSLCGFSWFIGPISPLVYGIEDKVYEEAGITYNSLSHLDDIALIKFEGLSSFIFKDLPKEMTAVYYGQPFRLEFKSSRGLFDAGKVRLTVVGEQLRTICGSKPIDGFVNYVLRIWMKRGITISSPYPQQNVQ